MKNKMVVIIVFLLSLNINAQNLGKLGGTDDDDFKINYNNTPDYNGRLILQSGNDGAFILGNYGSGPARYLSIGYTPGTFREGWNIDYPILALSTGAVNVRTALYTDSSVDVGTYLKVNASADIGTFLNVRGLLTGFAGVKINGTSTFNGGVIFNEGITFNKGTTFYGGAVISTGKLGIGTGTRNGDLQFANTDINRKIVLKEFANNDFQFCGLGTQGDVLNYQSITDHIFYTATGPTTKNEILRVLATGGIKTDKVILKIGTFPDYVFDKKYNLMPIEAVAQFISKNKHLPNMPTEKEVVAQGLDLGHINTKMVEKIEELTLYIIEQNRKSKQQEELIQKLGKRLDFLEKNKSY